MKKLICVIIISTLFVNNSYSQDWINVGNGIEKNIYDLISFDGKLYACGRLGTSLRGVYFWDGTSWNNTNSLWGISYPLSLEVYEDGLYTSGDFIGSNGSPTKVFKWKNSEWIQQGDNFIGADWNSIKKLKKHQNYLYAGGQFELIGNIEAKNIAKWDGQEWENVGDGIPDLIIEMDVFQDRLVVCHSTIDTVQINDSTVYHIPRSKLQLLEDSTWVDLDSIFNYKNVNLLGVINDDLYFASRDTINGLKIENVGIWDGANIISVGDTSFYSINHVIEFNNEVYASCQIKTSNPFAPVSVIRKRIGNDWTEVGGVFDDNILTLHNHIDNLFIGGFFEEYESAEMKYVSMLVNPTNIDVITKSEEVNVCPNPAYSEVQMVSTKEDIIEVEILSLEGEVVLKQVNINLKGITFNVEKFPSSIYVIKSMLKTGEVVIKKIIIN
jgi:hypothetical protein